MKMDKRNEHRKTCAVCLAIDLQTLDNAVGREITQEQYQNASGKEADKFAEILANSWVTTKHPDDRETQINEAHKGKRLNPELKKIVEKQARAGLKSLNNTMIERYGKDY